MSPMNELCCNLVPGYIPITKYEHNLRRIACLSVLTGLACKKPYLDLLIDVFLHMFREAFEALPQSRAKESHATILNPFAHLC